MFHIGFTASTFLFCWFQMFIGVYSMNACGRSLVRRGRIKGGDNALEGEFPWLVSIQFTDGFTSNHHCGGSLLNENFVVTAAHCMINKKPRFFQIMAGEYDVRGRSSHEQIRGIKSIILHEDFGKNFLNDIALIELKDPVYWSRYVRPICLPDRKVDQAKNDLSSDLMTVAGWGHTDEDSNGGHKPRILQKAVVPEVTLKTCQKWFDQELIKKRQKPLKLQGNSHICAGFANGKKDACPGDSGGPLMKIDSMGREILVGLVSSGIGCGRPNLPGIYTKLSTYIPWIKKKVTSPLPF